MISVLFVEASTGGVVGGSLSGLYHLIRGLDRGRFRVGMALYESKVIESDFAQLGVPVYQVWRPRLQKEHALLRYDGYHRARSIGAVRAGLHGGRHIARLLAEELPAALVLARVIRRESYDVAHLGNGMRANFDGILACVMTGTPAIVHVKGFEKYEARERWASRRTTTVVCMTQAVLEYCKQHGLVAPDIRVVYDAVDEAWLRPQRQAADVLADLGVPAAAKCIGIAGNIQEWKGQHVLIEAMGQLAEKEPTAHCVIVGGTHRAGEGYAATVRERVKALGLSDRIHFVGFREDIPDVMNAFDVLVHASVRPEPFGRVILEGMLLGKPVVATAAGGVPELIEHERTGFLVPPGDVDALAACLKRILAAPEEARSVGRRAQLWARPQFSLRRQVAEMSEIYEAAATA